MRKISSYQSERSTDGSFGRPDRCRTEAHRPANHDRSGKNIDITAGLMVQSELFSAKNNKINHSTVNTRPLRAHGEESPEACKTRGNLS
jgi:hypothetical protein